MSGKILSSRFVHRPRYEILQVSDFEFVEQSSLGKLSFSSSGSMFGFGRLSSRWIKMFGIYKTRTRVILMHFHFLYFQSKCISCQSNKSSYHLKLLIPHILTYPMNFNKNQWKSMINEYWWWCRFHWNRFSISF